MLRATHGHLASKNVNKRQRNIGRWFEVMTAGTADKVALYWYPEPSVFTHRSWCGDYTHKHTCTLHARNSHTNTRTQHSHVHMQPRMHTTLTHTCTHACTHQTTNTHSHAQVINLHAHAHTSGPDRHIHNQVVPAHGLESCRACVNLCPKG